MSLIYLIIFGSKEVGGIKKVQIIPRSAPPPL